MLRLWGAAAQLFARHSRNWGNQDLDLAAYNVLIMER